MTVPGATPVPVTVWPTCSVPALTPATVRVVPLIEPLNTAWGGDPPLLVSEAATMPSLMKLPMDVAPDTWIAVALAVRAEASTAARLDVDAVRQVDGLV